MVMIIFLMLNLIIINKNPININVKFINLNTNHIIQNMNIKNNINLTINQIINHHLCIDQNNE